MGFSKEEKCQAIELLVNEYQKLFISQAALYGNFSEDIEIEIKGITFLINLLVARWNK